MPHLPVSKEALFTEALALPAAERGVFLAKACGANVDLLAELVALIAAHEGPDSLVSPALSETAIMAPDSRPGDWIGRYRLLQQIGEGGCGVVWMAEQEEPVRRRVAVKVIKLGMDTKAVIARFEAERQALAMMDHPHIAKVHDAGSTESGRPFFVMELVRGVPITRYCDEAQLKPAARLELFIKVCQAIQHAHQKGIIHRDLKPSNILVTVNDGQPTPKVIDFGIAKATQGKLTDATLFTAFEQFIGTPVYMSPEQAEMSSLDIDTRSDIYSLGVLLYELLTGRPPFDPKQFARAGVEQIRQQIRETEPPRPSQRWQTMAEAEQTTTARQRGIVPSELSLLLRGDLDWIVMRCLEKDRTRRYDTANGLAMDIQRHLNNEPVTARPPSTAYLLQKLVRRHRFGFAAASVVLGVVVIGAIATATQATRALRAERDQNELREAARQAQAKEMAMRQKAEAQQLKNEKQEWVRRYVLPEINRLIGVEDISAAYVQAVEAEKYLVDDPALNALWPQISVAKQIETTPPGAEVFYKEYRNPESAWRLLGKSPLSGVRLPRVEHRWQFKLDGYSLRETATGTGTSVRVTLEAADAIPPDMVRVAQGNLAETASGFPAVRLEAFLIDRFEVTNRRYKEFVDRGAYSQAGYWAQPFVREGASLTWAEAMAIFRDSTGQPGPAAWRHGTYPDGQADHPVTGISWYEAAAYAAFVGKRLPTVYHWRAAVVGGGVSAIVPLSNFAGGAVTAVGAYQGMTACGAFDLAGNAKEWCWNEASPGKRYILGGAANEPDYLFMGADYQAAFDRSPHNGFRCIKTLSSVASGQNLDEPLAPPYRSYAQARPVSDEVFEVYRRQFAKDRIELAARVEPAEDSNPRWRRERATFNAAYGTERMAAYLFLPKHVSPPYQTVIYFPPINAMNRDPKDGLVGMDRVIAMIEQGRALVYPIYKGTYERSAKRESKRAAGSMAVRDALIQVVQDLSTTIDYLETRPDLRLDRLAYFGSSWGASMGPLVLAVEKRLAVAVLGSGGLFVRGNALLPEVDPFNYASRITQPILMVNGRYDFSCPLEISQKPLFELLGTPAKDKRHALFDSGHIPPRERETREVLDWLNRYQGVVK